MKRYCYEILLGSKHVTAPEWQELFLELKVLHHFYQSWRIILEIKAQTIYYFLETPINLPLSLKLKQFLFQPVELPDIESVKVLSYPYLNTWQADSLEIFAKLQNKHQHLFSVELDFSAKWPKFGKATLRFTKNHQTYAQRLTIFAPSVLLSLDFSAYREFAYRKIPKYFSATKILPLLSDSHDNASFAIEVFPHSEKSYLHHQSYDFFKHSLILGGSGSGKSKLIASLIDKIARQGLETQRVVVIDPHDALKEDLLHIPQRVVVDYQTLANSSDLFAVRASNLNVNVELMLGTFKSLIGHEYNSRLERVLRYCTYLLLVAEKFTFTSLRKLLLDLEYRNQLLHDFEAELPTHVAHFFLTDFNELRTKSYDLAFAPLISFIDEMQMLPVFNTNQKLATTSNVIEEHFLSIFSLNRLCLGDKITRTIAALLMQQLFLYSEQRQSQKQLTIIIDEVAVVEQPILARFLSELRKYQVNVILAGQYFGQISADLRAAVLANTANYYLFHVSRADAELLAKNLNLKLEGEKTIEDRLNVLTGLKARECILQITHAGKPYSAIKARTLDYDTADFPAVAAETVNPNLQETTPALSDTLNDITDFLVEDDVDIGELMRMNSTSRKLLN